MLQLHAKSNNHETAWWILKIFEGGLWLMLIYFFSELRSGMKCPVQMSRICHVINHRFRTDTAGMSVQCFTSLNRAKFLSEYPGRSQCPDNYYISMVLSLFCFPCMIAEMGQCVESKNFSNQATNHDFNNIVWPLDFKRPSNISRIQGWSGLGTVDILTVHIFIWNKLMNKCSPCSSMTFHILGYSKCSAKKSTRSLLEGRKLVRSLNTIQYRKLIQYQWYWYYSWLNHH